MEQDLFHQLVFSPAESWQLTMSYGHMNIENVSCGSVVLLLRPLTDHAVKNLLNAEKNNKLVDIIFGMLMNIKFADKIGRTEPLEIKVQVYYAGQAKEIPGE